MQPLPGPIYAPIPPRGPTPPPLTPQPPKPTDTIAPAQRTPTTAPVAPTSPTQGIIFETKSPGEVAQSAAPAPLEVKDLTPVTAADVGLKANITKILEEVKMPERRDAGAATANPALAETPLTDSPFRATTQLNAEQPKTGAPLALELSIAENKIATPVETGAPAAMERSSVMSLHTMKSDLQDVVRQDKVSVVRAVSMEQDKRSAKAPTPRAMTPPPAPSGSGKGWKGMILMVMATLILIGLGGAALYAIYYLQTSKPAASAPATGLLFAEQQLAIPIDAQSSSALKETIKGIMNTQSAPAGGIVEIKPTIQPIDQEVPRLATLSEFFRALGTRPTDEFVRSLSDEFFFGIHYADAPSPIFVIPVVSYDHAFAGMLAWEKTINTDLGGLFVQLPPYRTVLVPAPAPVAVATTTAATSTTATSTETTSTSTPTMVETQQPITRVFEDLVMRNYDVRALKDDNGSIVLYYSFPTQNLLIISASPYTFTEVLSRLQAARKL